MNFKREFIKDYYLRDTNVENIFINEYMTEAPGDFVKVYLFALMYADYDLNMSNETIAKHLGLADEDVLKAWSYWEGLGIIKKHYEKPSDKYHYQVEILNLKERVYVKKNKGKQGDKDTKIHEKLKNLMDNDIIKNMYSDIESVIGRLFEGKEPTEILSWISDYNATPEMVVYAYKYCKKKRNHCSLKYVAAIVKEWTNQGFRTIEQIENYLVETDSRHYLYKRVLRALGFMRNATEEEKRIMDIWFDQMGHSIDRVLEACKKTSGISNPNINYINSVLKAWNGDDKTGGKPAENHKGDGKVNQLSSIFKYYDEVTAKNQAITEARRSEVYEKIPRIKEIEEETRNLSFQISRIMLSGTSDVKIKIKQLKDKVDSLNNEKAYLMTDNNYKIDYIDNVYNCHLCKDTGTIETGERCSCYTKILEDLQKID